MLQHLGLDEFGSINLTFFFLCLSLGLIFKSHMCDQLVNPATESSFRDWLIVYSASFIASTVLLGHFAAVRIRIRILALHRSLTGQEGLFFAIYFFRRITTDSIFHCSVVTLDDRIFLIVLECVLKIAFELKPA